MRNNIPVPTQISVLIADDHPFFRSGLKYALSTIPYISKVSEADSGDRAIQRMQSEPADIIMMDVRMPGMDGIQATFECRKLFPGVKILGLSMADDENQILKMMDNGASGYLSKAADKNEIDLAMRAVMKGNKYFSYEISCSIANKVFQVKDRKSEEASPAILKKDRIRDVLYLICRELTNIEIAKKLCLSHRTVEYYRRKISEISGSKTTIGFMKFAQQHKILEDQKLVERWTNASSARSER